MWFLYFVIYIATLICLLSCINVVVFDIGKRLGKRPICTDSFILV